MPGSKTNERYHISVGTSYFFKNLYTDLVPKSLWSNGGYGEMKDPVSWASLVPGAGCQLTRPTPVRVWMFGEGTVVHSPDIFCEDVYFHAAIWTTAATDSKSTNTWVDMEPATSDPTWVARMHLKYAYYSTYGPSYDVYSCWVAPANGLKLDPAAQVPGVTGSYSHHSNVTLINAQLLKYMSSGLILYPPVNSLVVDFAVDADGYRIYISEAEVNMDYLGGAMTETIRITSTVAP